MRFSRKILTAFVSVMVTACVYCVVRFEHLNTIQAKFDVQARDVAETINRRPFFVRTRVKSKAILRDACCGHSVVCTALSPSTSVFSCQYNSAISIYTLFLPEGQRSEVWEPSKKQCFSGNRGAMDGWVFPLLLIFKWLNDFEHVIYTNVFRYEYNIVVIQYEDVTCRTADLRITTTDPTETDLL